MQDRYNILNKQIIYPIYFQQHNKNTYFYFKAKTSFFH